MVSSDTRAQAFRRRAVELREIAKNTRTEGLREEILKAAEEWERLARFTEKMAPDKES